MMQTATTTILWFDQAESSDISRVGGKNAGLAEVTRTLASAGIRVPPGFADDRRRLSEPTSRPTSSRRSCASILRPITAARSRSPTPAPPFGGSSSTPSSRRRSPSRFARAYRELAKRCGTADLAVAVRSSATAEDLPQASFAGQQETYLNVRGESELLRACRKCYASLFTDRAIVYRETNGFDHLQVALSIGIQKMVRSDRAGSGVMFTLDTETGFPGRRRHQCGMGTRRERRAGHRQPGQVRRLQAAAGG